MAKKAKTTSLTKTASKPKNAVIPKIKYTSSVVLIAENAMLRTGSYEGVAKLVGVSRTTLYRWMKNNPDFGSLLARAHEERKVLMDREFLPEHVTAIRGLNILITGCVKELTTIVEKDLIDREANDGKGRVMQVMERRKTIAQRYYPPDFKAIEKILGPNDIKHNIYLKAMESHMLDGDSELYQLVFGELADDDHGEKYKGIFVMRLGLDLMKLRYMEAHIQHEYDQGNISIDSWMDFTGRIRRDFQQIADRMETRAQKLLGGVSYQDILLRVENVWQSVVEITEEAVGFTYNREGGKKPYTIPPDVQKQVIEKIVSQVRGQTEGGLPMLRNANVR